MNLFEDTLNKLLYKYNVEVVTDNLAPVFESHDDDDPDRFANDEEKWEFNKKAKYDGDEDDKDDEDDKEEDEEETLDDEDETGLD